MGGMIDRNCERCNGPFKARPDHVAKGRGRFCSNSCSSIVKAQGWPAAPSIDRVCAECGAAFAVRPSVAARGEGRFCSVVCRNTFTAKHREYPPLADRFWAKVRKTAGCWVWTAAADALGYGRISVAPGKIDLTHRVSWGLHNGSLADDICVLHRCDNPRCVRPDHLFLGTRADNNHDMMRKGRHWSQTP